MSFKAIRENKIHTKISESTVCKNIDLDLCPTFDIDTKFNPLCSDGFSYNKYGIALCVL